MKYRSPKSTKKFSRFIALSLCAWLLLGCIAALIGFYYHFELNFKTNFTQINSYLIIYQQRALIFYSTLAVIALFLLIIYIRIFSLNTHQWPKIILALIPTIFAASLAILIFNIDRVVVDMNIPLNKGIFALRKYLQSFSIESLNQAITSLPYQLNSIKFPLYSAIYSYLLMFTIMILIPMRLNLNFSTLWRKLNACLTILFILAFSYSAYHLINNFLINDPFAPYEQLLQLR